MTKYTKYAAMAVAATIVAAAPAYAFFPHPEQTAEMTIPGCNLYLHPESGTPCDSPFFMTIDTMRVNALANALQGLTFEGQVVSIVAVPSYSVDFPYTVTGDNGPARRTCRQSTTRVCLTGLIKLMHPFRQGSR